MKYVFLDYYRKKVKNNLGILLEGKRLKEERGQEETRRIFRDNITVLYVENNMVHKVQCINI
jgi:hypothetical protein